MIIHSVRLDIGLPVGEMIYQGDKPFVGHSQRTYEPYACSKYVEWGFSDNSVRLYLTETNKVNERASSLVRMRNDTY